MVRKSSSVAVQKAEKNYLFNRKSCMINFKDLFRFSQKEVSSLFKNATIKCSWRGLKLLQTPPDSLDSILDASHKSSKHESSKLDADHEPSQSGLDFNREFDSHNFGKLLIITPGASGKAHQRNLFRRRVKDIFYTNKLYLYPVNSVLIAYKNAMLHDFDHLQEFLLKNIPPRVSKVSAPNKSASQASKFRSKSDTSDIKPLKLWQRLFIATFDVIRPVFGFISGACIYPVSCSDYAKHMITTKPFYKSIPLVILRVLSCNPITALFMRWKNSKRNK